MKTRTAAFLALSILFSGVALAQHGLTGADASGTAPTERSSSSSRYIGVLGTYMHADDERGAEVDYGNGIGVLFGSQWGSGLGWEASLFADLIETGDNRGTDFYRQSLGLDVFYAFGNRERFTPFVLLGAAYARNDVFPDERDDQSWLGNAGLGFVTGPTVFELFRVRGELRYIYDDFETGATDYRAGLGLEFPIYRRVVTITETKERIEVVEVSTGLGDEDDDGIVDGRDKCPGTPQGMRVDGDGCELEPITALRGVTFELDSARLQPVARTILNGVAGTLMRYPDMHVEIAGHTDTTGSDEYNLRLSQRRAESVRNFLIDAGIDASRMTAQGYGSTQPTAGNDTRPGRERNRRVEMRIVE